MIIPIAGGFLLGSIFYLGLWFTIQKGLTSAAPAVWFVFSMLARTSIAIFGIYWFGHGDWHSILECLGGFIAARIILSRILGKSNVPLNFRKRYLNEPHV